jgi:putative redox protein
VKLVTVEWVPDAGTLVAHGARPDLSVTMAAPRQGRPPGLADELTGITPTEALLASIGGCTAWDVVEILRKQRQPVSAVQVTVAGEQAPEPPWPFTQITVTFVVSGRGLAPAAVERAVQLSSERYCSVMATVRGVASVKTAIEIVDVGAAGAEPSPDGGAGH